MSSWAFAPRTTRAVVSGSDENVKIANGEPIRVWGIIISNFSASADNDVYIESDDGTKTYLANRPGINANLIVHRRFIADQGVRVRVTGSDPTNVNTIIFHSHPGS